MSNWKDIEVVAPRKVHYIQWGLLALSVFLLFASTGEGVLLMAFTLIWMLIVNEQDATDLQQHRQETRRKEEETRRMQEALIRRKYLEEQRRQEVERWNRTHNYYR